jgi:hypothetical protein
MDTVTSHPSWDLACRRVEAWLSAHTPHAREATLRIVLEVLEKARELHRHSPGTPPVEIAMQVAFRRVEEWFAQLGARAGVQGPRASVHARAACMSARVFEQWPGAFLSEDPPERLIEAVRSAYMLSHPHMEISRVLRSEVDFGPIEDLARETWHKFSWKLVLRAFLLWSAVFVLSYITWMTYNE